MVCEYCGGNGYYEVYGKKYKGKVKCLECNGTGEVFHSSSKINGRYAKATFECKECGYTEYEDEDGLGYCPMCK